jgi:hypothetical protein
VGEVGVNYVPGDGLHISLSRVNSKGIIPLLFEGVTKGEGDLTLEVRDGNVTVGRYRIPIDLEPVTNFFEQYTVGDSDAGTPSESYQLAGEFHYASPPAQGEDDNYVLLVHGWNKGPKEKVISAATTFKRLYWMGYKGRLGLFRWPDAGGYSAIMNAMKYDQSEYVAWLSGKGLAELIKNRLSGIYHYKIHVLAHSQGNVVTGEALRELALSGQSGIVQDYIATQAAISASAWDDSQPMVQLDPNNPNGPATRDRPDLLGQYPLYLENPSACSSSVSACWEPYLQPARQACVNMYNFYNPLDYAVGAYQLKNSKPSCPLPPIKAGWFLLDQFNKLELVCAHAYWPSHIYFSYCSSGGSQRTDWNRYEVNGSCADIYTTEEDQFGTPLEEGRLHFDAAHINERFQAFAFGYRSYSSALGAVRITGSTFTDQFNFHQGLLAQAPWDWAAQFHSGQWTGDMSGRWAFWYIMVKTIMGLPTTPGWPTPQNP